MASSHCCCDSWKKDVASSFEANILGSFLLFFCYGKLPPERNYSTLAVPFFCIVNGNDSAVQHTTTQESRVYIVIGSVFFLVVLLSSNPSLSPQLLLNLPTLPSSKSFVLCVQKMHSDDRGSEATTETNRKKLGSLPIYYLRDNKGLQIGQVDDRSRNKH